MSVVGQKVLHKSGGKQKQNKKQSKTKQTSSNIVKMGNKFLSSSVWFTGGSRNFLPDLRTQIKFESIPRGGIFKINECHVHKTRTSFLPE